MHTELRNSMKETVNQIIETRNERSKRNQLHLVETNINNTLDHLVQETEDKLRISPDPGTSLIKAVHYTSLETLITILNKAVHKSTQHFDPYAFRADVPFGVGYLRLYSSDRSNDPQEGTYLESKAREFATTHTTNGGESFLTDLIWPAITNLVQPSKPEDSYAFLASFIMPIEGNSDQTGDLLPLWRAYGQDGHGCSITATLNPSLPLFRVEYGRDKAQKLIKIILFTISPVLQLITPPIDIEPELVTSLKNLIRSSVTEKTQRLHYLFKSEAYKYENEFRVIIMPGEAEETFTEYVGPTQRGVTTQFTQNLHLSTDQNHGMFVTGSNITLGPRVRNPAATAYYIRQMLKKSKLTGCGVHQSQVQYQGNP